MVVHFHQEVARQHGSWPWRCQIGCAVASHGLGALDLCGLMPQVSVEVSQDDHMIDAFGQVFYCGFQRCDLLLQHWTRVAWAGVAIELTPV
jgi:hypothetical protein